MWRVSFLYFNLAAFYGQLAYAVTTEFGARNDRVSDVLGRHSDSILRAVEVVKGVIPAGLGDVFIGRFSAKIAGHNVPARESTLVDSSIGMAAAVAASVLLDFPEPSSKVDSVLKSLVPIVAQAGGRVVGMRAEGRFALKAASRIVADLNVELVELVSDFAKPIAEHVNFALFEVLVRATGWRRGR